MILQKSFLYVDMLLKKHFSIFLNIINFENNMFVENIFHNRFFFLTNVNDFTAYFSFNDKNMDNISILLNISIHYKY